MTLHRAATVIPTTFSGRLTYVVTRGGVRFVVVVVALLWLIPSLGLLVTSFRTRAASSQHGWWELWEGGFTLGNYDQVLNSSGCLLYTSPSPRDS